MLDDVAGVLLAVEVWRIESSCVMQENDERVVTVESPWAITIPGKAVNAPDKERTMDAVIILTQCMTEEKKIIKMNTLIEIGQFEYTSVAVESQEKTGPLTLLVLLSLYRIADKYDDKLNNKKDRTSLMLNSSEVFYIFITGTLLF
ncbi:MAG: hypothetical protein ACHQQQ_11375 [Bacteroidota bacterium]